MLDYKNGYIKRSATNLKAQAIRKDNRRKPRSVFDLLVFIASACIFSLIVVWCTHIVFA